MTTLKFYGASFSDQPTRLQATIAEQNAKYRARLSEISAYSCGN